MSFNQEAMDRKVDGIEKSLKQTIEVWSGFVDNETQAYKLYRHLWKFDVNKCGSLTEEEFVSAMIHLNFVGTQKELIHLYKRYDINGTGKLYYKEFCDLLFGLVPNIVQSAEFRYSIERFRNQIKAIGGIFGIRLLRQIFIMNDIHDDGKLLKEVLIRGLRKDGFDLSDLEARVLLNCFDIHEDGFIQYGDFITGCRGNVSLATRNVLEHLFEKLADSHELTFEKMKTLYTGNIEIETFIDLFMTSKSSVTKAEFVDFYLDVYGMIANEEQFEIFLKESWKL